MKYSEWDRMWSEWLGEKPMEDFVRKSLNRNAHAHEDFTPIFKPDSKGFTTNSIHTYRLYNKNKDLA
jgi:hypothetical protein